MPGTEARLRIRGLGSGRVGGQGRVDDEDGGTSGVVGVAKVCNGVSERVLRKLGVSGMAKVRREVGSTFPVEVECL